MDTPGTSTGGLLLSGAVLQALGGESVRLVPKPLLSVLRASLTLPVARMSGNEEAPIVAFFYGA